MKSMSTVKADSHVALSTESETKVVYKELPFVIEDYILYFKRRTPVEDNTVSECIPSFFFSLSQDMHLD